MQYMHKLINVTIDEIIVMIDIYLPSFRETHWRKFHFLHSKKTQSIYCQLRF